MRKRTINCIVKKVFWYLIYLLPLLTFVLFGMNFAKSGQYSDVTLIAHLDSLYGISSDSIICETLRSLFGVDGILPFFIDDNIIIYFSYFVGVYLLHLCIDFILFIPKLCHKWMDKFTDTEDVT